MTAESSQELTQRLKSEALEMLAGLVLPGGRVSRAYADPQWWQSAACARVDPWVWYPEVDGHRLPTTAQRICGRCPVRRDCVVDGITEEHGVWGGLDPYDRSKLRQQLHITERRPQLPEVLFPVDNAVDSDGEAVVA